MFLKIFYIYFVWGMGRCACQMSDNLLELILSLHLIGSSQTTVVRLGQNTLTLPLWSPNFAQVLHSVHLGGIKQRYPIAMCHILSSLLLLKFESSTLNYEE